MTTAQFLKELKGVRDQFDWALQADTNRYSERERRTTPRVHIRGTFTSAAASPVELDPLRAVCYARTGKMFDYGAWSDVADALNMDLSAAAVLLAAANDRTWTGTGAQRALAEHILSIRQGLLEAVGLAPRSTSS